VLFGERERERERERGKQGDEEEEGKEIHPSSPEDNQKWRKDPHKEVENLTLREKVESLSLERERTMSMFVALKFIFLHALKLK